MRKRRTRQRDSVCQGVSLINLIRKAWAGRPSKCRGIRKRECWLLSAMWSREHLRCFLETKLARSNRRVRRSTGLRPYFRALERIGSGPQRRCERLGIFKVHLVLPKSGLGALERLVRGVKWRLLDYNLDMTPRVRL